MIDALCAPQRYDNAYRYPLPRLGQLKEIARRINVGRPPAASTLHQRRGIRAVPFSPRTANRVLSVWSNHVFPVAPPTRRRMARVRMHAVTESGRRSPGLWLFHLQTGSLISAKAAAQKRGTIPRASGYRAICRTSRTSLDYWVIFLFASLLARRFARLSLDRTRLSLE